MRGSTKLKTYPLHHKTDLISACVDILCEEWPRNQNLRYQSIKKSNDEFPIWFVCFKDDDQFVVGCCFVQLLKQVNHPLDTNSVFLQSFLIRKGCRQKGLGTIFLKQVEDYLHKNEISRIYLTSDNATNFYLRCGFCVCEPVASFQGSRDLFSKITNSHLKQVINSNNDGKVWMMKSLVS
ncbi:hypothetical protein GJ496_005899 [Pomphorhynchus laevis]|nr:hypothetical protein GJ496_005899 [Pomphorhynchus laevis]